MDIVSGLWWILGISWAVWIICTIISDKWPAFIMSPVGIIGYIGSALVFTADSIILIVVGLFKLLKLIIGVF